MHFAHTHGHSHSLSPEQNILTGKLSYVRMTLRVQLSRSVAPFSSLLALCWMTVKSLSLSTSASSWLMCVFWLLTPCWTAVMKLLSQFSVFYLHAVLHVLEESELLYGVTSWLFNLVSVGFAIYSCLFHATRPDTSFHGDIFCWDRLSCCRIVPQNARCPSTQPCDRCIVCVVCLAAAQLQDCEAMCPWCVQVWHMTD